MAEITSAKRSRGQLNLSVKNSFKGLHSALETADLEPPPEEDLAAASLRATRAIEAVDRYESSIDKVNLLEPEAQDAVAQENKSHEDSLLTYRSQLDDLLDKLSRLEARAKKFSVSSSQVSARAQVKAPPLLAASVDLNSFISWRQAFYDWARVTGIAKEERSRYVSHLKALLSIEMRSTLELAIGIDSDSDKNVDTILDALYAHIRASRNVAIDRVDFEKRVQRSGEKFNEFLRGILELRNTPKSHGKSPAELIYNRPLRSHIPSVMPNPSPQSHHVTEHIQQRRLASKENYDRTTRELPPLHVGQHVNVQDSRTHRWSIPGRIIRIGPNRDYMVDVGKGRNMWRNRRFIRPTTCPSTDPETKEKDEPKIRELRRSARKRRVRFDI